MGIKFLDIVSGFNAEIGERNIEQNSDAVKWSGSAIRNVGSIFHAGDAVSYEGSKPRQNSNTKIRLGAVAII